MQQREWLDLYLEGWRTGDADLSLSATAPAFFYDDPDTGRIRRDGFRRFFEKFRAAGAEMAGGKVPVPFLQYSDLTVVDTNPAVAPAIAWCWWRVTGTEFRGAACIRFDQTGVLNERIAYFTDNPNETAIPAE
ncbi:hypothetical protein QEZ52_22295 (plasmid) [Aliisedimentitalea scapharcae]|uniref:SnoaL-like domain-containing protein n=1 Tax=Aliisedimentitalea scapharcae TaxID=1524259 RepID=A0ABZ2Y2K6_9RHOB